MVVLPVLLVEFRALDDAANKDVRFEVNYVWADINKFFEKSEGIVESVTAYMSTTTIVQRDSCEAMLEQVVKGVPQIFTLYYTNEIPFKDGGFFYI